ncbi:MAG: hypothetical protein Q8S32_18500 [Burkholderiaceae bacterium]|uniref:hypothetical protein n=1 Tax=Hydrogenophaga sp. TaxID=1904254 RepID=UPI002731946F|nr:hypothetical protein [Hydrogenophaga sp.]MDP2164902.1 hypothetical protein [Hydrogenophaga sp.]MDP3425734.1 hypothetical protein [Burkholderiaceae bacterium]
MNTKAAPPASRVLLSTTLHHLDLNNSTCTMATISSDNSDLGAYLDELLHEISIKPQHRGYQLSSSTTEFATSLDKFYQTQGLAKTGAEALAARLLRIEIQTDAKYGHLNPTGTHIRKGSFLQYMYQENSQCHYLGVKVDHHAFLDEKDLRKRIGLGQTQKLFKACRVVFDVNGAPQETLVFDTNVRPSVYWWREFWELKELRSDQHNTEAAIRGVIKCLNPIKKLAPTDYTHLRNAAITAFKQTGSLDFPAFVNSVFTNYQPVEPLLVQSLPKIVQKIKELPTVNKFDAQFTLAPSAVPFRRMNVAVSEEISLSYNEDVANIDEKIWSSKTRDGRDVIVIRATEAADRFKFRDWS